MATTSELYISLLDKVRRLVHIFIFCIGLVTVLYVATQSSITLQRSRSTSIVAAPKSTPKSTPNIHHGNHSNRRVPSILCLVLTSPKSAAKMAAVNETWGRRCNRTLYVLGSKSNATRTGDKLFVRIPEDRAHLPGKVKAALEWTHSAYGLSYDWVMKADDDTYVIVENLRLLLSRHSPNDSLFLGSHFKKKVRPNGYMSGGAGYVLSSRALRDLVTVAFANRTCKIVTGNEDVQIGECLQSVNATVATSLSQNRKETFHAETVGSYLEAPYPKVQWLKSYLWNEAKFGSDCCDRFSISFHHMAPRDMHVYEHLLYRTGVNGNT